MSSASLEGDSTCDKPKAAGEAEGEEMGVDIFTDSDGAVDSGELGLTYLSGRTLVELLDLVEGTGIE